MAKKQEQRRDREQGMLNNIGGRDEPSPKPGATCKAAPIGWMGYVGGALWAMVFCGVGLVAWLFFTRAA